MMTDAGVMLILGVTMIIRGISYWSLGAHVLVNPLDTSLPSAMTSGWWISVGVALVVASKWQATAPARVILMLGIGTLAAWGSLFLFAPPAAFAQRGIVYLALATVIVWSVWRGRRGEVRVRTEAVYGPPAGQ
ncbi:hypothetical protein HMPREF0290_0859 [Corynebacterium efficiens YS-314]|nr:hypothetical protein HMPREF0290_0859 [Corynebacterium efficiens YS-314]